jgi:hypothetical protein
MAVCHPPMKRKSRLLLLAGALAAIVMYAIYSTRPNVTAETLVGAWKADASGPGTSIEFFPDGKFTSLNFRLETVSRLASKPEKSGLWKFDKEDQSIVRLEFASESVHAVISRWRQGILTAYVSGSDPDAPRMIVFEKQK